LNIEIVTACEHLILISTSGLRHTLEFIWWSQPCAWLFGDHHHWHTLPKHDILWLLLDVLQNWLLSSHYMEILENIATIVGIWS